ncbi:hypothetical protein NQ318_008674 [Aromia moschata]|uniref:Transporter n=1 Tax=Aromia moschata TaxID=1265417 RepID=A0AAV8XKH6_9CUCU|nr:hypothetical protein NQ318_008674 [Aromia moschata]
MVPFTYIDMTRRPQKEWMHFYALRMQLCTGTVWTFLDFSSDAFLNTMQKTAYRSRLPPNEYPYDDDTEEGSGDDDDSIYIKPRRQHWANKLQFVLACVGYSVGLGSIWRFPYLCYKSGGAVFLIPYAIIMVFIGGPMLYMELAVGQFTGRGPIGALGHLCPYLKVGYFWDYPRTGLGSVVISFLLSTYYGVIIAYGVYYFFTSFRVNQPWVDCSHRWNTKNCWIPSQSHHNQSKPVYSQSPAEEFYE